MLYEQNKKEKGQVGRCLRVGRVGGDWAGGRALGWEGGRIETGQTKVKRERRKGNKHAKATVICKRPW